MRVRKTVGSLTSLSFTLAAFCSATSVAEESPPPSIEAAIAQSKATGIPLLVEFGATWCEPCKLFKKTILPRPDVQTALEGATFISYDSDVGPGIKAAARYGNDIAGYPTFAAIDADGKIVNKMTGVGADREWSKGFLAFIKDSRAALMTEDALRALVAQSPKDPAVLLKAGRWYSERGRTKEALVHFDAIASMRAGVDAEMQSDAHSESLRLRRAPAWRRQLTGEYAELARRYPAAPKALKWLSLAALSGDLPSRDTHALFAAVLGAITEPHRLNDGVYVALAAGAKEEALVAAQRLNTLSPNQASVKDTLAEAYYVNGQTEQALRVEDEALALSKTPVRESLVHNRARYASGTGEADDTREERETAAKFWKSVERIDARQAVAAPQSRPDQIAALEFQGIVRGRATEAAKKCSASARGMDEVYLRLTFGEAAGPPKKVVVLEPDASAALKACLIRAFKAEHLPSAPSYLHGRQVIPVRFEATPKDDKPSVRPT